MCCGGEAEAKRPARPKIDRSMIGQPTNFQHTGHIGSGDMGSLGSQLPTVELQMQGKGGHLEGENAVPDSASPASNAITIEAVSSSEDKQSSAQSDAL
jgi:hypothetical protein